MQAQLSRGLCMNADRQHPAHRRRRRLLAWLGLSGPLSGFGLRAHAATPALQLREVAASVWFAQGEAALGSSANRNFISNAGFVVTGDGVVVVDALG